MQYEPLQQKVEDTASLIVDAAFAVHRNLGPGLLEKIYETCFCHELEKRNLHLKDRLNFLSYTMAKY
jgi:GxxExxY protein